MTKFETQLFDERAQPFYHPGSRTGCILIHGFTSTPHEMRWIGNKLSETWGFSVMGVRLAGHGTSMQNLERSTWQDWLASVEDAYHFLRPNVDRLIVVGSSMGGALALSAAADFPVDAVVAISAPYDLPRDKRLFFLPLLKPFFIKLKKGKPDWQDSESVREHVAYTHRTPHGIVELDGLLEYMRSKLPEVTAPLLMFQSVHDITIPANSMDAISSRVHSNVKETNWVITSGHVIPIEPDKAFVTDNIAEFIKKIS
ncbi:MAG: alpha/beta fold hydrolase [Anaerolineaceae bacterium]|nr:alpha/beta fold hydrolase [Anaerolineaceae bacterium]